MSDGAKVCFVVNHVAFFASHRLPLATRLRDYGYQPHLVTGRAGNEQMEREGELRCDVARVPRERACFSADGLNPVIEMIGMVQLALKLRRIRPEVVHCASPKGNLYGAIAAQATSARIIVLAISGMGFGYTNSSQGSAKRKFVRIIQSAIQKIALRSPKIRVIVQNTEDEEIIQRNYPWLVDKIYRIPGSGVDLDAFRHSQTIQRDRNVVFAGRLLEDKGLFEFIEAAQILKVKYPTWKFVVAGAAGYRNPSAVSAEYMNLPSVAQSVEWLGHVEDMPELLLRSSMVCSPSYREGMPKILLEAAAAGCAVVTTAVAGCEEAVVPNKTAIVVPARDSARLATAIESLINDRQKMFELGQNGRLLAEERYSLEKVVQAVRDIYQS